MNKKHTGKRVLSLLLAAVLATSLCVPTLAAGSGSLSNFTAKKTYENQFTDVKTTDWYYPNAVKCYQWGLMNGTSATNFGGGGNFTEEQACILLARIHHIYNGGDGVMPETGGGLSKDSVAYLTQNSFDFQATKTAITRINFALWLAQILPAEELAPVNTIGELPDLANTADNAGVYTLFRAGVISGSDTYGTFKPTSNISRAEVAAIVCRLVDVSERKTFTLENKADDINGVLVKNFDDCPNLQAVMEKYSADIYKIGTNYIRLAYGSFNMTVKTGAIGGGLITVSGLDFEKDAEPQYELVFALIDDMVEEESRQAIKDLLNERKTALSDGWTGTTGYGSVGTAWIKSHNGTTQRFGNVNVKWLDSTYEVILQTAS